MAKQDLKKRVCQVIEERRDEIIAVGEEVFKIPELGYKEKKTTAYIIKQMEQLGLKVETNLALTGCKARARGGKKGPVVAVLGELDAVICREHPAADPDTGAVHACGHNAQLAAMMGVATGLLKAGVMDELAGQVYFMAVPAEEYVELEYRSGLIEGNKIKYLGGKQELISRGLFDDIDLAMMIHSLDMKMGGKKVLIGPTGNGFRGKRVQFIGRESHAGGAPEKGINALNAAMLAMMNIHVQRETFPDEEKIRVHPIITKGGDIVNIVPADVRMETYVRGRSISGIKEANYKVNRSLVAGAEAVGAGVKIDDLPGYLPLLNNAPLDLILEENLLELLPEEEIQSGGIFTGSFDFGDVSHLMPVLHPMFGGVSGDLHTRNFQIEDPETAFILPAKAMAMTIIDLLYGSGEKAREVIKDFKPVLTREKYLKLLEEMSQTIEKGGQE